MLWMQRVLRVRAAFEPSRGGEEQLRLAYARVLPTVRRACGRRDDAAAIRAGTEASSAQRKEQPR